MRERFTYSAFGDVTERAVVRVANGTVVQNLYTEALTFDRAGRIATSREDVLGATGDTRRYVYDDAGRLVRVDDEVSPGVWDCVYEYVYDANGNRDAFYEGLCLAESGTPAAEGIYDGEDSLSEYGGVTYAIDANGTLEATDDGSTLVEYDYDAFGNLRGVVDSSGLEVVYWSDVFDRRIRRRSNTTERSTYWVYADQLRIIGVSRTGQTDRRRFGQSDPRLSAFPDPRAALISDPLSGLFPPAALWPFPAAHRVRPK